MLRRRLSFALTFAALGSWPVTLSAQSLALARAPLVDQFGTAHDFSRGAIGDRVVIVGFTWAGCSTVCPITDQLMLQTHAELARTRKSVRLITLSLAPGQDNPAVMRERARKFGADANWLWLSGRFADVQRVLQGLNADYGGDLARHPPRFLIIDGRRRIIQAMPGLPTSNALIQAAERMAAARL